MLNLNKGTKTKPKLKPTLIFKNCSCVCIIVHNYCTQRTQNSSDNFLSYAPDDHYSWDDV